MERYKVLLDQDLDDVLMLVDDFNRLVGAFVSPEEGWFWVKKTRFLKLGEGRSVSKERVLEITDGVMPDFSKRPKRNG